ncbi:FAD-dependent oxidoreductase [Diaphorobacter sp. HDW4B]|uniref:D-amino acid dehydrogenase n=1 Tax=Diaphorobacter sp. HDW4B TaxID=2714925 RepID=UPI001407F409|nr:D-amino acid dehydrogenase [Diaphorobacter sp. HDW4B]QIL70881.1 FAD-dependent oxidoreductase [Diaphorobacter sp. HDW4B]
MKTEQPKHICIVGAGIVGLATAYVLQQAGHRVTVVDRAPRPAMGASGGNGAQLSYSYVQPLADPGIWKMLPKLLLEKDSPLKFRLQADPQQWRWGMEFLGACNAQTSAQSTRELLTLAAESRKAFEAMQEKEQLACDFHTPGKLVLFASQEGLDGAAQQVQLQSKMGGALQRVVNAAEVARLEPALAAYAPRMVGAVHTPSESAVDCRKLCEQLAERLQERGVQFQYGTEVQSFDVQGGSIAALNSSRGKIGADHFVLASGWQSAEQARQLGASIPVYPLKGYSITLDATATPDAAPQISVTDTARKVVFARTGERLRVAGMVEIVGRDTRLNPARIESLKRSTREVFPHLPVDGEVQPWTGMRPATPKGLPITGRQKGGPDNLWMQTGHGALGLTLAFGSATELLRQMSRG